MAKHDPNLDLIFQALSDPTRRAMLTRLSDGPVPVSELARPTGLALPTVMRHLSVLQQAQLIRSSKSGRIRTCSAIPETMVATLDWMTRQRALWDSQTDRLEAYVKTLLEKET